MPRGERVCWSIFKLYIYVPGLFPLSSIQSSPRLHLSYSLAVYPLWWVDSTLLALPGTFRVHDKGMQSADAQGAYHDGRCSTARVFKGDAHFSISSYSDEDL